MSFRPRYCNGSSTPGYDIIASKRRLEASDQQDLALAHEPMRAAAVQYYDLVLAQGQVAVAHRSLEEAAELLRIEHPIEDWHRPASRRTACPGCTSRQKAESLDSLECFL